MTNWLDEYASIILKLKDLYDAWDNSELDEWDFISEIGKMVGRE